MSIGLAAAATGKVTIMQDASDMRLRLGGCGGVFLLPEPGELVIEIMKQDRNKRRPGNLRAVFFGPDRQVFDDVWIPDDGQKIGGGEGPVQTVRLATTVRHRGVYGVMITSADDRYGDEVLWGFRTNCGKAMVETSRGHRDVRHEEPLVLVNPTSSGDICFLPRAQAFELEISGLPTLDALTMYDAKGAVIETLSVAEKGRVTHTFAADVHRDAVPWRLHLPKCRGTVKLDAVTRWDQSDDYPNVSLWTPDVASWFPFHANRWLLTPYSQTVYGAPGAEGTLTFEVGNGARAPRTVRLALEYDAGVADFARLDADSVDTQPSASAAVSVHYRVPVTGAAWTCRLRATAPDGFSTYSSVLVRKGEAPAMRPLALPLVLQPYRHENEQFGYLRDYPVQNQVYFDLDGRPFVADKAAVIAWRDGAWSRTPLLEARGRPEGAEMHLRSSKIAFDADNDVYAVALMAGKLALLHSADHGASFTAYPVAASGGVDIEQFSGHNTPAGPPPFVRLIRTAKDPKLRWRSLNDLFLFVPEKRDGTIVTPEPVLVSRRCIGLSNHSGIPSSIVSRGSKVHVTWGEATDPKEKVPGVPTYVVTYDRSTGALGKPALIGYGPPANDVHNSPCITMDSKGVLHVLVGTHGRTFKYARSLEPNTADGGWTKAEEVGPGLGQTYVGLVCDRDDTLHLVFRIWQGHGNYFPAGSYACLGYMSKKPGEPWSEVHPLVVAAFSDYSIYYHRLTIDQAGRLFLSYDYWSTYWFYRTDRPRQRALLTSGDGGVTWKLASGGDLGAGVEPH